MNAQRLEELGLSVRDAGGALEADLNLGITPLLNPLTRSFIEQVTFTVVSDRLIPIAPPEVVGLPPLGVLGVQQGQQLVDQIVGNFDGHIVHLQRRSAELQALGIPSHVQPETLELSAQLDQAPYQFLLYGDKQGQLRVARVFRDGQELELATGQPFELSEFRERAALGGYLLALFNQGSQVSQAPSKSVEPSLLFSEVASRFGVGGQVPARSALEILVELRVAGARYRFAAARLSGRSFRGLLAGPSGKLWAERFELDGFPGVAALLARTLNVPIEQVEILTPKHEA